MRTSVITILCALALSAAGALGQCVSPGTETFDGATVTTTSSCGLTDPGVLPMGWALGASSTNAWRVRSTATTSSGTGPSADHTSGSGNYLFTETSGTCSSMVAVLEGPCFDASGLVNPAVEFWYHMFGDDMGELALEVFDGSAWSVVWSLSGNQGDAWRFVSVPVMPYTGMSGSEVLFRFRGTAGPGFESDMALDDVTVGNATVRRFQENQASLSVDINGVTTDVYFNPARVNYTIYNCYGNPGTPFSGVLNVSSDQPGEIWDIAMSPAPIVCCMTGGTTLPDGQIVNLDLLSTLTWMSSGTTTPMSGTIPGGTLPGVSVVDLHVAFEISSATNLTLQGVVLDPAQMFGIALSQATELNVAVLASAPSVPGPVTDDSSVAVDVTAEPSCWSAGGINFYGTNYSTMYVSSNGRVLFGGADNDFTPSLAEAQSDNPFVGYWTDLDPALGGSITISNPFPGIIRVMYLNVPYAGEPTSFNTFAIEFNTMTDGVKIDAFGFINPNPLTSGPGTADNQFIGASPGNLLGATDAGTSLFSFGNSGIPGATTDMIYDWNDPSVSMTGLFPSGGGLANTILLQPSATMVPNYDWMAF